MAMRRSPGAPGTRHARLLPRLRRAEGDVIVGESLLSMRVPVAGTSAGYTSPDAWIPAGESRWTQLFLMREPLKDRAGYTSTDARAPTGRTLDTALLTREPLKGRAGDTSPDARIPPGSTPDTPLPTPAVSMATRERISRFPRRLNENARPIPLDASRPRRRDRGQNSPVSRQFQ